MFINNNWDKAEWQAERGPVSFGALQSNDLDGLTSSINVEVSRRIINVQPLRRLDNNYKLTNVLVP